MPCYSCSAEFGILKKEVGCQVCGFSFCSKCCKKQQAPLESGEIDKSIVCNQCYKQLTSNQAKPNAPASPPLAHKKRMEALKKQSMSVDSASHIHLKSQWSNEADKNLAERLQRLKRDRILAALPSENEIEQRLAKLKGMDPARYTAPPIQVFRPTEKLTSIEQAGKLMEQYTAEAQLDAKRVKPEDEIAARLAKLRDQDPPLKTPEFNIPPDLVQKGSSEEMDIDDAYSMLGKESKMATQLASEEVKELNTDQEYKKILSSVKEQKEDAKSDEDDDEEADELVKKLLATNLSEEMDDLEVNNLNSESSEDKQEEELPWCVICTDDAKIRCLGCDGDLYCNRCFKECHDSLDIKDHRTFPFLPRKQPVH